MEYKICKVSDNFKVANNIFEITITGDFNGKPGQFYMLRAWEQEPVLSRPISIYDLDKEKISFVYQVKGRGTEIISKLKSGDEISLLGPLGNGFPCESLQGKVAVVTGGIGIAPMMYTMKQLKNLSVDLYCGFRNDVYLLDEMKEYADNIYVATEDGSVGTRGFVTEVFKNQGYSAVLCCGPEIMMNAFIKLCDSENLPIYVSMEKHMACGIGACLVCTCKTKFGNKKTCKDGPVFLGSDVIIDA